MTLSRKTLWIALFGVFGSLSCSDGVSSRPSDVPDAAITDPDLQKKAEAATQGLQGAFLIARDGKVLAAGGVGLANRVTQRKNGTETRFRLASCTKPITATSIMQLYERGALDLSDTIEKYIPDYGANGSRIKIHHLLSHSSGLPDYVDFVESPAAPRDLIDAIRNRPLIFSPGSKFAYSNSNYAVLGYLIEKITKMTYAEYVQENIFNKAGMTHSGFEFPESPGEGFAAPSGGNPKGPWEPNDVAYSSGALYASVQDMFYFNYAFYSGALIRSPETIRKMHTRQAGVAGYGFMIESDGVSHNGMIAGFTSQLYSFPSSKGLIMVLANGSGNATTYARKLKQLFLALTN